MTTAKQRKSEAAKRRAKAAARAEAQARARARRNRVLAAIAAIAAAVGLVAVVLAATGGDEGEDVAVNATTSSVPAPESAAGKPCVAAVEPPPDAPAVPVKEGPPPTELVTEDLQAGSGDVVAEGATVTVHYIGVACSTGAVFDASYGGEPATFPLGQVIPGWGQGIPGMKVGGKRLLGIPPELAYGAQGSPPTIAPDETLWFVVEVLSTAETPPPPPPGPPPGAPPGG